MTYKQLIYCNVPILLQLEANIIYEMQRYYKRKGKNEHIAAFFNYNLKNNKKKILLCALENYKCIYFRLRKYKPKEYRKCDISEDRKSIIFVDFYKKKAFSFCGYGNHLLFVSKQGGKVD